MRCSRSSMVLVLAFALLVLTPGAGAAQRGKAAPEEKPGNQAQKKQEGPLSAATFAGLELRGIGPALMSGRIADVAIDPRDQATWYVAVGSGGVWKTTNSGTTWESVFDGQGSYSIGDVALDPSNPDTVWVGTGENVGGRHVGYGDGVYRSRDGGKSWQRVGLEASEHIGTVWVDPRDSDTVLVAAQGPLWSAGGDRGLYKTTDGGATWRKVLGGGEYTGVNELAADPRNPDVLYASTHQRHRNVAALVDGGPESGIHKSTDGGETWRELTRGLPEADLGKIGLAVSPFDSNVIYAGIELAHREGGFYRSADGGESWEKRSDYVAGGTGPHYYQELFASPHQPERVYHMDWKLSVSEDGGRTWRRLNEEAKHVDNHAMAFSPHDPDYLLVGTDGGLYESWDLGQTWKFVANLPVTQFYKIAVDDDAPFYNVYGGTQDNSTQGGPTRTDNVHGIRNSDWFVTLFADGHQPATEPGNPDIVYSEWQQGNLVRYDRRTGEIVYIKPQGEPGDPPERFNWDAPILVSPHDPKRLYFASQRVWRSDDRGDSWRAVSGDLTRDEDRLTLPVMGRVQGWDAVWDLTAMSSYNTITSLAESPLAEGLLYAGTDDGRLQVSEDGGATWRLVDVARMPGVPERAFVNDVKADLHDADTVYVALDNHKAGDFAPYLVKSTDRGRTWRSIAGDLPERHLVWRLVQDHERPGLLFAGTEFGVFFTLDGGARWIQLTGGVPTIAFRDLAIQRRENDLVGGTFGRGIWILDDYTPLRQVSAEVLEREAVLFPVEEALWYVPKRSLGGGEKASQGDSFFTAPNPPFGAVFTYYLKEGFRSLADQRRERDRERAETGEESPYPGWEALRAEAREEAPGVVLTVRDDAGRVVRRVSGPAGKGFHRVAWDLRYPSPGAVTSPAPAGEDDEDLASGFLAGPGTYRVVLERQVDGRLEPLGPEQTFRVVPLHGGGTLPGATPAERTAFMESYADLVRRAEAVDASLEETARRLDVLQVALSRSRAGEELFAMVRQLETRVADLELAVSGDGLRRGKGETTEPSIDDRLGTVFLGNYWSTYGPTPTHRRSLEIAGEELTRVQQDLRGLLTDDLPRLERAMDAAGVPWTPGRLP
ncbi:MAG TPA: glycosyl hydrolase [Thermoanaerobaculia bacterium]|nr:glycosyl hydrolase [Thermoanaerobaculia bacterium]